MLTYTLYILLVLVCYVGYLYDESAKKRRLNKPILSNILNKVIFLFSFLLAGLRHYSVGIDSENYFDFYETLASTSYQLKWLLEDYNILEPSFLLINLICIEINSSYTLNFLVNSFLSFFILNYFIKNYVAEKNLFWLVFIASGFFFSTFNMVRQMHALMLFIIGIEYALKRNFKHFFWTTILGGSLHYSAYCLMPMYYLVRNLRIKYYITNY